MNAHTVEHGGKEVVERRSRRGSKMTPLLERAGIAVTTRPARELGKMHLALSPVEEAHLRSVGWLLCLFCRDESQCTLAQLSAI
jgi:hypothetical protein